MTTSILAIPLFGDHIAPRFCFADEVLIVEVVEGSIVSSKRLVMNGDAWPERLARLATSGVRLLLCSGFNRRFRSVAARHGIQVVWGLSGRADELVDIFCTTGLRGIRGAQSSMGRKGMARLALRPLESVTPGGRRRSKRRGGPGRGR